MNTLEFLKRVQPEGGLKVLCTQETFTTKEGKQKTWLKPHHFQSIDAAAEAVEQFDSKGKSVYHACNGFGEQFNAEKKNRIYRTQENVVACRSIYDDFDVDADDPDKYESRNAALADAVRLAQEVKLTPTITSSGGGFHMYFHCDEDMTPAEWEALSAMKRDISHHLGLKNDPAVDMDSARVLRPIGAHNHKTDVPRPVQLIKEGKVYTYGQLYSKLDSYIKTNSVSRAPAVKKSKAVNNMFAAAIEYPPSNPDLVAEKCWAVKNFIEQKGDVSEPYWHKVIGLIKHTEDGEAKCHEWSALSDTYAHNETQDKINAWGAGPPSCATMDAVAKCKQHCPHANKIAFPITLGHEASSPVAAAAAPSAPTATTAMPTGKVLGGRNFPFFPSSNYGWNNNEMKAAWVDPQDNTTHWRPFCRSLAVPINRVRDTEGVWHIHWVALEKNGNWREFFMPTSELASADRMAATLAANEVFLKRNSTAKKDMADFTIDVIESLQLWRQETKTYKQFGWTPEFDGFIIGNKKITAKGEEDVLLDTDEVPSDINVDFGTSGTLTEWVDNIDTIYNRPGAEPFQFALCHSMGSALVPLVGSTNWHGLAYVLSGGTSGGKSTNCKIACGFWGNPALMERQTGEQGSTLNAAIKRIAVMGSVPVLLDEFSGRKPEELIRTAYSLGNGRDKERLGSNGKFTTVGGQWFKNSFITSNDSLQDEIAKMNAADKVEATQLRFFEVKLEDGFRANVFGDLDKQFVEHHMDHVYGHASREFLRSVMNNMESVKRLITNVRSKFNYKSDDDSKERFYRDTATTAYAAAKIAKKLGLIKFDIDNMMAWTEEQIMKQRENRKLSQTEIGEHLASFIATLPGRLIITKNMGDGRKDRQVPLEPLRSEHVGRVAIEDKRVYINVKAVKDWCTEHGVKHNEFIKELDEGGYIRPTPDNKTSTKVYLGAGTTVASGQSRCYEIHYHKMFGSNAPLHLVETDNGVSTENMIEPS